MPEKNLPLIVADTNVLVSALLGKSLRIFIELLGENKFMLAFSEMTYQELFRVLKRPKFKEYITQQDVEDFQELLSFHSQLVIPYETITDCRDPKDNIFLECALAAKVDHVVTGDPDLLVLHPFRNVSILTPQQFLKIIAQLR